MKNLLIATVLSTTFATAALASPITDLTPVKAPAAAVDGTTETAFLFRYLHYIWRCNGPSRNNYSCGPLTYR